MIIDIRSETEYMLGHIKNAISIPAKKIYENPKKYLDIKTKYYMYCNNGFQSKKLVDYLNNMGYQCENIEGGFWKYLLRKQK